MYEDAIGAILFDLQQDPTGARVNALRGQPPPQPPGPPMGMPPPGPSGPSGPPGPPMAQAMPPPQPMPPRPMPQQRPQAPRQGPILPQAMGQGQPAPAGAPGAVPGPLPGGPPQDDLLQRQQALAAEYQQALQPPDRAAAEEAYRQRAQGGGRHLLMALAAKEAGKDFAPIQQHFLRQAAEAQEPMKMAGGTMTPEGFIQDPGYAQEFKLKKIEAQMAQNDRIIASNAARQDKIDAERRNEQLRRDLQASQLAVQQGIAAQASADRRFATVTASGDRQAAAAAAGGAAGKATEGERSAAGYLGRMQAVEGDIERLFKTGAPGVLTKALGGSSAGRIARPFAETPAQQQYRAVQEDWVRAKLRKESGASIPPDEMEREIETYFPQPGETDPEIIRLKTQARAQAAEQIRSSAGRVEPTIAPRVGGAVTPPAARPVPPPPKVGEVRGGYTYKGGNPADPNSWSK